MKNIKNTSKSNLKKSESLTTPVAWQAWCAAERPREVCFYRGSQKRAGVGFWAKIDFLVHVYQTDPCVKSSKNPVSH